MHSVLSAYLLNEGKQPVDYILEKFEDQDIVLLGEMHYFRQQVELYHRLIPILPDHGITIVATEFGRRADLALNDESCPKSGTISLWQNSSPSGRKHFGDTKSIWIYSGRSGSKTA
ncbi:MAG: hypothetical protein V3576_01690 [Candidatus Cloacimonadota bacterium]